MNADQAFLDELTTTCEQKAKDFDQRSSTRVGEITAITKALEILKSGVQPNYGANKKLVGFVQSSAAHPDETPSHNSNIQKHDTLDEPISAQDWVLPEEEDGNVQFIQLRGTTSKGKLMKALTFIEQRSRQLKSTTLQALMLKINLGVGKDHFVKVRGLIKDLIAKLEADAEAEASQKAFCDENMKKATTDRDIAIGDVETATANIDEAKSKIAQLTEEIEILGTEIADLRKGLFEATELRNEKSRQ
jgi:polyhydroxyalkanoate synthesis regulator phasin